MSDELVVPPTADGSATDSAASEGLSVGELCLLYQNDNTHTFFVGELATLLFERTRAAHRLPDSCLPTLQAGAKLHNIGLQSDPMRHHILGKEIVMGHGVSGFSETETRIIALAVLFHRKKPRIESEPLLAELTPEEREQALRIAALVRVADGLDYSQDQSVRFTHLDNTRRRLCVFLAEDAPSAQTNADRANEKADLWDAVMVRGILFRLDNGKRKYYLRPGDTMQAAGYKALSHYFENVCARESGARAGEDIEELHQFRVAMRRLRSGLRVFRNVFGREFIAPMTDDLSLAMEATGEVRDMDVFLSVLGELTEVNQIPAFLSYLHEIRGRSQERMTSALDDTPFRRFKETFAAVIHDRHPYEFPIETKAARRKVRSAVPRVLRRRLEDILSFREVLNIGDADQLHSLRIACKRFRYTADVFAEVLEAGRGLLVRPFTELQDSLGEIHDATVRREYVLQFLNGRVNELEPEEQEGLEALLGANHARHARFLEKFQEQWEQFLAEEFQKQLVGAFKAIAS